MRGKTIPPGRRPYGPDGRVFIISFIRRGTGKKTAPFFMFYIPAEGRRRAPPAAHKNTLHKWVEFSYN